MISEFHVASCVVSTLSETVHSTCQALCFPKKLCKAAVVLALVKPDEERKNLYYFSVVVFIRIWLFKIRSIISA
jgi:hypothetical protein